MAELSKHTDSVYFLRRLDADDEGELVDAWGRPAPDSARTAEEGTVTETGEVTDENYEGDSQYKDWTNSQLSDEIKRRREEGREIHLDGKKKADAIRALDKDDAAQG